MSPSRITREFQEESAFLLPCGYPGCMPGREARSCLVVALCGHVLATRFSGNTMSWMPSRSSARTTSAFVGHVLPSGSCGSHGRSKAIATPTPSDEDDGDDSSDGCASEGVDPSYQSEIPMEVLFDAPRATQTQGESSQVMDLIAFPSKSSIPTTYHILYCHVHCLQPLRREPAGC
jgi:hypothetical protein